MRDLDALAFGGKQHGMLADDVAGAHRGETDLLATARPALSDTLEDAIGLQVTPQASATTSPSFRAVPEGASTL